MSAHTPGPWVPVHFAGVTSIRGMLGGRAARRAATFAEVRTFEPHATDAERDEINANADLIAAAPDLLEALRDAQGLAAALTAVYSTQQGLTGPHPTHAQVMERIAAAIAKAEGRS